MHADYYHLSHAELPSFLVTRSQTSKWNPFKPNGLWISSLGEESCSWESYLLNRDGYGKEELFQRFYYYQVKLDHYANLLHIHDYNEAVEFTNEYLYNSEDSAFNEFPSWVRVANEYDGIMCFPYSKNFDCHLFGLKSEIETQAKLLWYYSLDCESGCIWNPAAIESTKLLSKPTKSDGDYAE